MQSLNVGYYKSDDLRKLGFGSVGENVWLAKNCHVLNPHRIFLGGDVKIHPFCSLVAYEDSSISIGNSVHIGGYSLLFGLENIKIGCFTSISTHVRIFTASDDFSGESLLGCDVPRDLRVEKTAEIIVADHCGMGSGALLLPGAGLAAGCVLGAHSMLKTADTEPWHIYAGNPAKKIKVRSQAALTLVKRYPENHNRKQT